MLLASVFVSLCRVATNPANNVHYDDSPLYITGDVFIVVVWCHFQSIKLQVDWHLAGCL